ncbi:MAG: DUF1549 domain-containing protein, partial [bacterium]|nr:DUF1549 domain-containing protein [bacterium]
MLLLPIVNVLQRQTSELLGWIRREYHPVNSSGQQPQFGVTAGPAMIRGRKLNVSWLVYCLLIAILDPWDCCTLGQEPDTPQLTAASEAIDFFESRIRPVLIDACYDCHAADTEASGGLLLDSQDGWAAGGDSGRAIVAGDAAKSLVFKAISYENPELQMPPDGKLPASVLSDFRVWIDSGAADPRRGAAPARKQTGLSVDKALEHWAYRPLDAGSLSADDSGSAKTASTIDGFLAERLQAEQLPSAPQASRAVLARRLYFDLLGLPPSEEALTAFVEDPSPFAYEELVDRLLASPRFGERFARHWMDVARYADSITLRGFVLPQAWRYRDYLIASFNGDRPFDQMIQEQVAGDLLAAKADSTLPDSTLPDSTLPDSTLPLETRQNQLVATAFLALGNTNLEQQDKTQLEMDFIDEQLEVIGRAFLGQTLGCARCHDHKFDPIPTKDYYALAGIFRSAQAMDHDNVSKWIEQPLPLGSQEQTKYEQLEAEKRDLDSAIAAAKKQLNQLVKSSETILVPQELPGVVVDSQQAKLVGNWKLSSSLKPHVGDGYIYASPSAEIQTATFEPERLEPGEYRVRFAFTAHPNRSSKSLVRVFSADGEKEILIDQKKTPPDESLWIELGSFRFEKDGQAYVLVSNVGANGAVVADAVQFLPAAEQEARLALRDPSEADEGSLAGEGPGQDLVEQTKAALQKLESDKKELEKRLNRRPKYLTVVERGAVQDIPIHIRGDVHNLGEVVPRGFLTAVSPRRENPFTESSGRLEFAQWLTDEENPLTARVYANRVWLWLMGQGLVSTPNNFGTTGRPASHPELLDWLAQELIAGGWSTKHLVRTIVLSEAYRKSSLFSDPQAEDRDPDNRLYWRGHRRKLSAESLRDAMLRVSGELDLAVGGSLVEGNVNADYGYQHRTTRRSIYHPVFRNALPELYEAFD